MADGLEADVEELFALLRSYGALKRAYVPLRQALPDALRKTSDAHGLVLCAIESLLDGKVDCKVVDEAGERSWPGSSGSAYCSLLIEATGLLGVPPPAASIARATDICRRHPNFFRKLVGVYGGGGATCDAALAAARTLWDRGDSGEVCNLLAEFDISAAFDVRVVLRAAISDNKQHAAARLGAARPEYALALMEEYCRRGEERQAIRLLPRLNLTRRQLPSALVRQLRIGALAPRLRWLAHSRLWDQLDATFASLARAASTAPARPVPDSLADLNAAPEAALDATAVERLVAEFELSRSEWLMLARQLVTHLKELGLRAAAVQGCWRHALHELADELDGVSEQEAAAALAASEEDVATGAFHLPLAVSAPAAPRGAKADGGANGSMDVDEGDSLPPADGASTYMSLEVPATNVFVVADALGLEAFCTSALGDGGVGVLGIDVEWSDDQLLGSSDSSVQWVQLSTGRHVFLLDIPALTSAAFADELHSTLSRVFSSPSILKLGYGLKQDLSKLRRSHPSLAPCAPELVRPSLELAHVWLDEQQRQAQAASGDGAASGGDARPNGAATSAGRRSAPGLSQLVEQTLGKPLNKAMQMSNWRRRPITRSQLEYAALDAHCLVLLFVAWERRRLSLLAPLPFAEMVPPQGARGARCCHADLTATARAAGSVAVDLHMVAWESFAASFLIVK